jgi:hypothetical protein
LDIEEWWWGDQERKGRLITFQVYGKKRSVQPAEEFVSEFEPLSVLLYHYDKYLEAIPIIHTVSLRRTWLPFTCSDAQNRAEVESCSTELWK